MKILVCGADGFLGRHIVSALHGRGHEVVRGVHRVREAGDLALDYRRDLTSDIWLPRVDGVDAVVNAVGILHEREAGDFDRVHRQTPEALFQACAQAGVRRVVQISALGNAATPYLTSKQAADQTLWCLLPDAVVLRPGLVFGRDGVSTRFFLALASLPIQARPCGAAPVQPVQIADIAEIVVRLLEAPPDECNLVEAPGPQRLGYDEWLALYRKALGLAPALRFPIPDVLMATAARIAGHFPGSLLSTDTWTMLRAGNIGDPATAETLLGRALVTPSHFIARSDREALRLRALAAWQRPLERSVIAAIWLGSALVSAGLYPIAGSLARLVPFGLSGAPALGVLTAATLLDAVMGLLTLLRPGRRLWLAQLALVGGYTLLVTLRLPAYLLDPFGPILKNLAVLALLIQLLAEEEAA